MYMCVCATACNHYREKNDEVERSVRRERRAMQVKDVDRAIYTEVIIACITSTTSSILQLTQHSHTIQYACFMAAYCTVAELAAQCCC
jgi:hypothetical protein